MNDSPLDKRVILITGAGRRIGHALALACARAGADVIIHYDHSNDAALETRDEIMASGRRAWILAADLRHPDEIFSLLSQAKKISPLYGLVNNAAIFKPISMKGTSLPDWEDHLAINLTAPFLLSQGFAEQMEKGEFGRIVNILDWRALRPGADHFSYSVSKAALAAFTRSAAISLAPNITVNGLALGAILPPTDNPAASDILNSVPASRWGKLTEVEEALIFLLTGPGYITGEIIHVDGGRHLV